MNDTSREAFEEWYCLEISGCNGTYVEKDDNGCYYEKPTHTAWLVWQAAQDQAKQEPDINAEDVLRISKSGYSIKLGWAEKRIVASAPNNQCTEQWLEDAQRLCDGWNRTSPPNQDAEIAELKVRVKDLEKQLDDRQNWNSPHGWAKATTQKDR